MVKDVVRNETVRNETVRNEPVVTLEEVFNSPGGFDHWLKDSVQGTDEITSKSKGKGTGKGDDKANDTGVDKGKDKSTDKVNDKGMDKGKGKGKGKLPDVLHSNDPWWKDTCVLESLPSHCDTPRWVNPPTGVEQEKVPFSVVFRVDIPKDRVATFFKWENFHEMRFFNGATWAANCPRLRITKLWNETEALIDIVGNFKAVKALADRFACFYGMSIESVGDKLHDVYAAVRGEFLLVMNVPDVEEKWRKEDEERKAAKKRRHAE